MPPSKLPTCRPETYHLPPPPSRSPPPSQLPLFQVSAPAWCWNPQSLSSPSLPSPLYLSPLPSACPHCLHSTCLHTEHAEPLTRQAGVDGVAHLWQLNLLAFSFEVIIDKAVVGFGVEVGSIEYDLGLWYIGSV